MERLLFLGVLLFLSCSDRTNHKEVSLAVSDIGQATDSKKPPPLPLSPYGYYGCFNFIYDSTETIYFYQHFYDRNLPVLRVIDFDSDAPIFINLDPSEMIIIPADAIKNFIDENVLKVDKAYRSVRVTGMTNPIKSKSLLPLLNILNDKTNDINYLVRKITFEENVVLDYKKKQQFYYPDKVSWDSTKVWFQRKRKNSGT